MCHTEVLVSGLLINPLDAESFWENTENIFSFRDVEMKSVIMEDKDLWLLMSRRLKDPGHQQPWYWPSSPGIFLSQYPQG